MDVIPGDAVVPARGDTLAHREHQSLGPGQVDPVQSQLSLRGVWTNINSQDNKPS